MVRILILIYLVIAVIKFVGSYKMDNKYGVQNIGAEIIETSTGHDCSYIDDRKATTPVWFLFMASLFWLPTDIIAVIFVIVLKIKNSK